MTTERARCAWTWVHQGAACSFFLQRFPAPVCVRIRPSFWRTCTEFRSAQIRAWMKQRGDSPCHRDARRSTLANSAWAIQVPEGLPLLKVSVPPRAV